MSPNDSSVQASEELVQACRRLAAADPAQESDLALALTRLSNRLSSALSARKALLAAQEAVHLYQRQADANPQHDTAPLARALNVFALRLAEVGRRDKALFESERAVSMQRMRVKGSRDGPPLSATATDLADSLETLALCLRESAREQESRAATREADEIRDHLREHRTDHF
ncbi:hypothetical protein [Cryobacterium psychrophilum]|uniref:Tetratricopeptide repeat protein n=1 Tax=Cryobacterium psychrophilum TaxID=41988 RepID=A0A4Y8KL72_9MICO|nr:hypothetical protein [Cryobacterium psychrophilum]TFD75560.1 hypothetical protein E3T53_15865 [Cryobacterium psychrophilum]